MSDMRHEYKYILDGWQEALLFIKAEGMLSRDAHVGEDGVYYISSLYFDDYYNTCYYENESGVDQRAKYRIRIYNHNRDRIRLEKKMKSFGMTRKESCEITEEQCREFMKGEIPQMSSDASEISVRLFTEMRIRSMIPKVIVTYERIPFIYPAGNVRITFDRKITSSYDVESFMGQETAMRPILPKGRSVLEIKWDETLPKYIREYLQLDDLQWTNFSKYYLCRKYNTNGGI